MGSGVVYMTDGEKMDRALAGIRAQSGGGAESEAVSHQNHVERETRSQGEKSKLADWYQRVQPASNERSDWSGKRTIKDKVPDDIGLGFPGFETLVGKVPAAGVDPQVG